VRIVVQNDPERLVRLRIIGLGGPADEVVIPTRYGGTVPLRVLPLAGREVLLATIDGNGGTGLSQRLGCLIGIDAAGRLRVIGIESLDIQDTTSCESEANLRATLSPASSGILRMDVAFRRSQGDCGFRWRGRPHLERWIESLSWNGRGILSSGPQPQDAGPIRHATAVARSRVLSLLAMPTTDLRRLRLEQTGLYDLAAGLKGSH
jgi:hypothetical protein